MSNPKWQLPLFFLAVIFMAAGLNVNESIFNSFLSDTYDPSAQARGWLEFPRELPGFLVVMMTGVLAPLAVSHLGIVGALIFVAGMVGLAFFGDSGYSTMVAMMMIGSAGMHLLQPVQGAIALSIGDEGSRGRRLGMMGAIGTIGAVAGTGFVWLFFDKEAPQYRVGFLCAGAGAAAAAIIYWLMHLPHLHQPRARLVVSKRFRLYYVLEFLFGARKQIFITFGFWVLIKVYNQPAASIAGLLMTASLIGIVFKPLVGAAIDHLGERTVMIADGILLAVVCVGYGYADKLTANPDTALRIASACFIADNLLFALGNGRSVYVSRLTESAQELTSTLAMGVSINHIASMVIPVIGGTIWMTLGYEHVFVCAAVLALGISAVATLVPRRKVLQRPAA